MDPMPANSPASKRRGRRHRRRRRDLAAVSEAAGTSKREAPVSAQRTAHGKLKKKKHRLLSVMDVCMVVVEEDLKNNSENRYTYGEKQVSSSIDAQGGRLEATNSKLSKNSKGGVMSTEGDPSQQAGCYLGMVEAHLGVGLVQTTSKQMGYSKEARKRNYHAGNREIKASTQDGVSSSFHAFENSIGNADVNMDLQNEEDPNCPEVKNTDLAENKNRRRKKRRKRNNYRYRSSLQENSEEANKSEAHSIPNGSSLLVNSNEQDQTGISPKCNSLQNLEESKKTKKKDSLNSSPLKEKSEENKKPWKRRRVKKHNNHNKSTSQGSPLPAGTDKSGSITMVAENRIPGCERKGSKKKRNQNEVSMTNSFLTENVKMTEGKNADVDSVIEKNDGVVQPGSFDEEETKEVTKRLSSCMLDSNKVTRNNVPFTLVRGVGFDANVKANCPHSTTREKVCQSAVAVGSTNRFNVVSCTRTSEDNEKMGPVEHMGKASLPSSPIRGVMENVLLILPMKQQRSQLDSFSEGAHFFQTGNKACEYGSDAHHDMNVHGSSIVEGSKHELSCSSLGCTSCERNEPQEQEVACSLTDHSVSCVSPSSLAQARKEKRKMFFPSFESLIRFRRKKLLILDLNGLLVDINQDYHNAHIADAKVRGKLVFRRPYCNDFLSFCFQNFELGIWSSRKKENVDSVVNILLRDVKPCLLFCWDLSKCTATGRKTLENIHKPLVLKELKKLWNKEEPGLPWEEGDYSPSNTLLVDDSPYKALRNPPHTAVFPYPYSYLNRKDESLGPGGDLRMYLEKLAAADDVECYVRENPFGQSYIRESDPHWNFYVQIADRGKGSLASCA